MWVCDACWISCTASKKWFWGVGQREVLSDSCVHTAKIFCTQCPAPQFRPFVLNIHKYKNNHKCLWCSPHVPPLGLVTARSSTKDCCCRPGSPLVPDMKVWSVWLWSFLHKCTSSQRDKRFTSGEGDNLTEKSSLIQIRSGATLWKSINLYHNHYHVVWLTKRKKESPLSTADLLSNSGRQREKKQMCTCGLQICPK